MITQPQKFTILGIPIDSAGRGTGVERLPGALRAAGLVRRLEAEDLGDLPVTFDDSQRDPATGIIGFESVQAASAAIQTAVGDLLAEDRRPLLLGGDCTLLIGVAAALKGHFGAAGLAFIDGHLDFYDGRSSPTGETADMELAILNGLGPAGLVDLAGPPPLVAAEHVAVLGYRDGQQAQRDGAPDPAVLFPAMTLYDAGAVRQQGMVKTAKAVSTQLAANPGRFWLHLDFDVLDQAELPAVDYPMPNGLKWGELATLLLPLARSPALIGADVTIINPTLDPDGAYTARAVNLLCDVFL